MNNLASATVSDIASNIDSASASSNSTRNVIISNPPPTNHIQHCIHIKRRGFIQSMQLYNNQTTIITETRNDNTKYNKTRRMLSSTTQTQCSTTNKILTDNSASISSMTQSIITAIPEHDANSSPCSSMKEANEHHDVITRRPSVLLAKDDTQPPPEQPQKTTLYGDADVFFCRVPMRKEKNGNMEEEGTQEQQDIFVPYPSTFANGHHTTEKDLKGVCLATEEDNASSNATTKIHVDSSCLKDNRGGKGQQARTTQQGVRPRFDITVGIDHIQQRKDGNVLMENNDMNGDKSADETLQSPPLEDDRFLYASSSISNAYQQTQQATIPTTNIRMIPQASSPTQRRDAAMVSNDTANRPSHYRLAHEMEEGSYQDEEIRKRSSKRYKCSFDQQEQDKKGSPPPGVVHENHQGMSTNPNPFDQQEQDKKGSPPPGVVHENHQGMSTTTVDNFVIARKSDEEKSINHPSCSSYVTEESSDNKNKSHHRASSKCMNKIDRPPLQGCQFNEKEKEQQQRRISRDFSTKNLAPSSIYDHSDIIKYSHNDFLNEELLKSPGEGAGHPMQRDDMNNHYQLNERTRVPNIAPYHHRTFSSTTSDEQPPPPSVTQQVSSLSPRGDSVSTSSYSCSAPLPLMRAREEDDKTIKSRIHDHTNEKVKLLISTSPSGDRSTHIRDYEKCDLSHLEAKQSFQQKSTKVSSNVVYEKNRYSGSDNASAYSGFDGFHNTRSSSSPRSQYSQSRVDDGTQSYSHLGMPPLMQYESYSSSSMNPRYSSNYPSNNNPRIQQYYSDYEHQEIQSNGPNPPAIDGRQGRVYYHDSSIPPYDFDNRQGPTRESYYEGNNAIYSHGNKTRSQQEPYHTFHHHHNNEYAQVSGRSKYQNYRPSIAGEDNMPFYENSGAASNRDHVMPPLNSGSHNSMRPVPSYLKPSPPSSNSHLLPYYNRHILSLCTSDDENWLSEFLCFVRSQCVEVFEATSDDVAARMNSKKVLKGQVGIRCRFCAHLPHRERMGRSSSFPSSINRIYQSLTMMLRDHFTKCNAMPPELKDRYLSLKANASQGATDSKRYWIDSGKTILQMKLASSFFTFQSYC